MLIGSDIIYHITSIMTKIVSMVTGNLFYTMVSPSLSFHSISEKSFFVCFDKKSVHGLELSPTDMESCIMGYM